MKLVDGGKDVARLLEVLSTQGGIDFGGYSPTHLKRRAKNSMSKNGYSCLHDLVIAARGDEALAKSLAQEFYVTTTEMFRDPLFYTGLIKHVFPVLSKMETISIWHAGCSSGEEVYSLSVLLSEYGLIDRCRILGTDLHHGSLQTARLGIYPIERMRRYSEQYLNSGGKRSLSTYYKSNHDTVTMDPDLRRQVTFEPHNLIDEGYRKKTFDLILCRNVMIYFGQDLKDRVFENLRASLRTDGYLCLGMQECLQKHINGLVGVGDRLSIHRKIPMFEQGVSL